MKRKHARIIALVIAVVMVFFTLASATMVFAATVDDENYLKEDVELLRKLMIYVEKNYVTEVDGKTLINGAYKGVYDALDPYSNFFEENEDYDNFVESVSGEYVGIGVVISAKNGKTVVISPMPGSPAFEQGMKAEDVIAEIDGVDVRTYSTEMIANLLRGIEGTDVNVGVERPGTAGVLTFTITRATIKVESIITEVKENNIGYIRITSFDSDTGEEFKTKIAELRTQNITSLIVDLRNNGGGYISTAVDVAEQLIPIGPVVHLEEQGEITKTYYSKTAEIDILVVVLINEGSASASEILAGAIQDTKTGILIGTQSFGKGSAQESLNLKGVGGMKLTIAHFLSPDKNIIHEVGLTPNIIVENGQGEEVQALIKEVNSFAPMVDETKPTFNDVGLNVYGAQQRLNFLGYENIEATGTYDIKTYEAVLHFQAANSLYAYGTMDYTTKDKLKEQVIYKINNINKDLQLQKAIEHLSAITN